MQRKRRMGARFGFSNEKFIGLLSDSLGFSPSGEYGRDTALDLSSLEAARNSLLFREIYSKYDDGKPSPEKSELTWKKFHDAESSCRESNKRIPSQFRYDPYWLRVYARIRDALGTFSWDECARHFGFGPGATTRLPRQKAAAAYKYSGKPECTLGNSVLASCAIRMNPLWTQGVLSEGGDPDDLVRIVEGNRVIVVPKNYKTDRTIAKEPDMNIYIQKGIGAVIRSRLMRVGVNLNDQTGNQLAARKGSIDGSLATIDLSMASDTVSFELVSFLLPNDWWWALEQCRSPVGVLPSGERLVYQKFSSMGNGYTFELESLIFWAICQEACCLDLNETDNRVLVYGDDLIVPVEKYDTVCMRLSQAGFTTNPKKSFATGPYRESCGKHYFLGHDITPFYVRRAVQSLDRLFLVHNNVFRWSERVGVDLSSILTRLKMLAPFKWREPRLPDGYGDGAFIGHIDTLRLDPHPYGWEFWQVRALSVCQRQVETDLPEGQIIASLLALSTTINSKFERKLGLREYNSGLPVREGQYREITLSIPRRTP